MKNVLPDFHKIFLHFIIGLHDAWFSRCRAISSISALKAECTNLFPSSIVRICSDILLSHYLYAEDINLFVVFKNRQNEGSEVA